MDFPQFIKNFPALVVPFSEEIVSCYAIRSAECLAVLFEFHQDFSLPEHSHKGQWGTLIAGSLTLTVDGVPTSYAPGDSYNIPSGALHSVEVTAGTKALDIFEEPDRYEIRPRT